ncbi:MAG: XRE family transcriptional regulator [Candidatus Daviesbacteria bacterium]|nr:XRE family transcriptional regulator [Candidatus Daviesbacteria bacterium]
MDQNSYCINPEVLEWARKTIGYSLEDAAKRLGVHPDELENWEKGSEEAPIRKIRRFAEIYKRATAVFLLNSIPEENVSPRFRNLLYKNLDHFSTDTLLAFRKAIRIQNLSKEIVGDHKNQFILKAKGFSSLSNYDKIALEIIGLLGLDEKSITLPKGEFEQLNLWKNAVEKMGIYVLELGFPEEEAKGFAIYDDYCPVIVLNTNDHPKVRIFTLLHELSHFVFNTDAIDDETTLFSFSSQRNIETACNYLAGSVLIPASYLEEKITALQLKPQTDSETSIEVLARVFNVSKQTILRRLYIEKYIQKGEFIKFTKLLREGFKRYAGKEEKKPRGGNFYIKFMKNNSRAFVYDVFEAYRVNKIGYFDILNLFSIKSSTLSKLENRL